jgi:choline monooxygenase
VTPPRIEIDPDIRRARTLPPEVYGAAWFETLTERVLARGWHLVADASEAQSPGRVTPFDLLPGPRPEPLVLACDAEGTLRCLSNACTHRGNLVVEAAGTATSLRCRYHGRRFGLDGRFQSMPRFEGAESFPSPSDDLRRVPTGRLDRFLFASLDPFVPFEAWIAGIRATLVGLEATSWEPDPRASRDYDVSAHWALYVDNYLEGFHIPFVHPALSATIDASAYATETRPFGVVQVARPREGEASIDLGARGRVAALYLWLFPTTMLNFYPWGLSVNVVKPLAPDRTRVTFRSYVRDASLRGTGAGADLDRVEREDESVVESVQRGLRARLATRGRYSPTDEIGVHHFHRLLAAALEPR